MQNHKIRYLACNRHLDIESEICCGKAASSQDTFGSAFSWAGAIVGIAPTTWKKNTFYVVENDLITLLPLRKDNEKPTSHIPGRDHK